MAQQAAVTAAVAIGLLWAGCLGASPDADAPEAGGDRVGAVGGNATRDPVRWAQDVEPWTHWENGTLEGPVSCDAVCPEIRHWDISDHVPSQVPVVVNATLWWERVGDLVTTDMAVRILQDGGVVYDRQPPSTFQSPVYAQLTTLRQDSTVTVQISRNDGGFGTPDYEYRLRIEVRADPASVIPHVPVALPVEPGATLVLDRLNSSRPIAGNLYAPDDQTYLRFHADEDTYNLSVPAQWPRGEPVVVVAAGASAGRLSTANETTGTLRALPIETAFGDAHEVSSLDRIDWTFEAATPPLAVVFYFGTQPMMPTPVSGAFEFASTNGTVLAGSLACAACGGGPDGIVWTSSSTLGDPRLIPGSYDAWFQPDWPTTGTVGHGIVGYVR